MIVRYAEPDRDCPRSAIGAESTSAPNETPCVSNGPPARAGGVRSRDPRPLILVVDDALAIRATLAAIFSEEGFRVHEARDGSEALTRVEEEEPDLVLLDLVMPVLDGWQVLEALQSTRKNLPVVILSGVPARNCADYIQKPVSFERLLRLLDVVRARIKDRLQ